MNLCLIHEFVIVLASDLYTTRTAQISHTFPLP
jgi:hypothetical protein